MLFLMLLSTTVMAADEDNLTWDDTYEKTGYHLEKFKSPNNCSHKADKCAYIVSKHTGLYPTKKELLDSVKVYSAGGSTLKVKNVKVVNANGTPGTGGSVSPYALQVTVENVKFGDKTYTIASPYADVNNGMTGYNYVYEKFSWCSKTETWYYVGAEHYWLGTVDGTIGTNEVHNKVYTHSPQRYIIVPNEYTIKFDGNKSTSGSTAKMTDLEYNQTYTLTANGFKRNGYTFTGWNTKEDGSGKAYKNKAK